MIGNISKQGIKGEKGETPSISFRYDEKTGDLYYSSDGIMADKDYVDAEITAHKVYEITEENTNDTKYPSTNALKKYVDDKFKEIKEMVEQKLARTVTITLYKSKWLGNNGTYYQNVTIDNITQYSKVDLQPSAEQLKIFYEKDISFVTENENGVITVFCIGQKPTNDYVMQATITEVTQYE